MAFNINQKIHNLADVAELLSEDAVIVLGDEACSRIEKCREYLDNRMKTQKDPIYGITTGFGSLCNVSIDAADLSQLQKNLVMSHACSIGEEVPQEVVKLMMAFKIKSLSYGYSAVQLKTVQRLVDMFNNKVYPVVYQQGSLGASGDLAPLANMCLPILGLGEVNYNGVKYPAQEINEKFGKPTYLYCEEEPELPFSLFSLSTVSVSLKTLFPTAGAVILLFPVLSRVYGATGAGLAAFLSTVVWLSAYLFYYRRLINE